MIRVSCLLTLAATSFAQAQELDLASAPSFDPEYFEQASVSHDILDAPFRGIVVEPFISGDKVVNYRECGGTDVFRFVRPVEVKLDDSNPSCDLQHNWGTVASLPKTTLNSLLLYVPGGASGIDWQSADMDTLAAALGTTPRETALATAYLDANGGVAAFELTLDPGQSGLPDTIPQASPGSLIVRADQLHLSTDATGALQADFRNLACYSTPAACLAVTPDADWTAIDITADPRPLDQIRVEMPR